MTSTLHILSNPSKLVHIDLRIDAFAVAIIKFVENMQRLGWNCIHYGIAGSSVPCETVVCLPEIYNDHNTNVKLYNQRAGEEIGRRKKPKDLIMCFHGWENQDAAYANSDLLIVEPSIGYDVKAIFAPFRAFTSYAQMHMYYGHKDLLMTPSWYDTVIPNAFTPGEFEFSKDKKDYVLCFGRVIENKGINVAIQATERSGHRLIIAGPGELKDLGYTSIPSHVTCVGSCDVDQRRSLMRDAIAVIGPTYYVEPFGNMVVEGYFSGTPAITTDWGGFADTVVNGVTGFRCREMRDFVHALENISSIKSEDCRQWAMDNYSEEVVHDQFHEYFTKIQAADFYRP